MLITFPITRNQVVAPVQTHGFRHDEADRIVVDLEVVGRVDLTGSILNIRNPTDPDAS